MSAQTIEDVTKLIAEAMKQRNETRLAALRLLKAALLEEKTSAKGGEMSVSVVARKLVAKNNKSIEEYKGYGDKGAIKVSQLEAENAVLRDFLPQEMGDDELRAVFEQILAAQPEAKTNFGLLMRAAREKLGDRVEGRRVSDMAKKVSS